MATTDKYDRQLRLWGAKGQRALGETTVVLFRATAAGTETLKNLVLPGVGKILVVDDSGIEGHASNFFVTPNSTKTRAEISFELLQELNPDVQGKWKHVESLETLDISSVLTSPHQLVVAADLEPPLLEKVSKCCSQLSIPLIVVQSYGLIGLVRLQAPTIPIIEPKPGNEPPDLRLVNTFDEFREYAESVQLEQLNDADHGHVPYPVILWKMALSWKESHGGSLPSSFQEKQEFRNSIQKACRKRDLEVNFEEAEQNAYLAYKERELDLDHLKLLQQRSEAKLPKFHAMITALLAFVESHNGQPPLKGTIPDMTASTAAYVKLQGIYHKKALRDIEELRQLVSKELVADEELEVFCKNVFNLDLLQTRTVEEEYNGNPDDELVEDWTMVTFDPYEVPEHTPLLWYIALRACHTFYRDFGQYPGMTDSFEEDVSPLQKCIKKVVSDMHLQENDLVQQTLLAEDQKFAREMVRYANAEIHTIATVVGGVASQEAVKVITGQYTPINNTYIFNGIASTGGVLRL